MNVMHRGNCKLMTSQTGLNGEHAPHSLLNPSLGQTVSAKEGMKKKIQMHKS